MTTPLQEEELRDLLKEGQTLYQISRQFNTTIPEIFKLGRSYGISFAYDHTHIPYPNKQDLESMYIYECMTQEQIASEFNVSHQYVSIRLHKHNIPTRGSKMPPKEVLERMYIDECMTQEQIASEFNVYHQTVSKWLRYYNIPTRVTMPPKEVLERMYIDERMTQEQIAKEFNVTDVTVGGWLRYYNIPTRGSTGTLAVPMPPKDDLLNYIAEGLNQHQIAEKYEVCDATIFNWCEYYGIPGMVNSYRCLTDEHHEWRYAVFDRDHRTCQKCGATNTYIQAHHIIPFADHPEVAYELENGITLCEGCHRSIKGREYDYIEHFAAITQPHLREHEVIESMPWEPALPPLQPNTLFPQEVI